MVLIICNCVYRIVIKCINVFFVKIVNNINEFIFYY